MSVSKPFFTVNSCTGGNQIYGLHVIVHNRLFAERRVLDNFQGLCGPRTKTCNNNNNNSRISIPPSVVTSEACRLVLKHKDFSQGQQAWFAQLNKKSINPVMLCKQRKLKQTNARQVSKLLSLSVTFSECLSKWLRRFESIVSDCRPDCFCGLWDRISDCSCSLVFLFWFLLMPTVVAWLEYSVDPCWFCLWFCLSAR